MNILAIDTAGSLLSVALYAESRTVLAENEAGTSHSELLMQTVDGLFRSSGLKRADLNLVACMKGPGSFTGLRIGYAAAKGLSLGLGIPLAAVPTLDCMALHLSASPGLVLPVMDAKKNCFFASFYRQGERLTDFLDADAETLARTINELRLDPKERIILTGPGADMLLPILSKELEGLEADQSPGRGRAAELLELVKSNASQYLEDENSGPLYIRKSDAELALGK